MTGARYYAKQRERQRDAQIVAMAAQTPAVFADTVGGAIVAMPVIGICENTRCVAYCTRVVRRGEYGGPRVRVAVYTYNRPGPGSSVAIMTRSARGWEFMGAV
jgi:hypothetical protein